MTTENTEPLHHISHFTEASPSFMRCFDKMMMDEIKGMRRPCWTEGGYLYEVNRCLYGYWSSGKITSYLACDNWQYKEDDWEEVEHGN